MANDSVITQQKLKEYHETYVYPFLNGISTKGDQAFVPCGKIEGFMRTTAPKGYLVCDGTEYLKSAYPSLAALLASVDTAQSTTNFAGSDANHFKVPDLRGEFLRGTGTNGHSGQGGGSKVGVHQDATVIPSVATTPDSKIMVTRFPTSSNIDRVNADSQPVQGTKYGEISVSTTTYDSATAGYTARPTNTSVLYCIAYQDLYLTPGHTYSNDEQVVGTWIDGKPIYEKTINFTTDATGNSTLGDVSNRITLSMNTPIDTYIDYEGIIKLFDSENLYYANYKIGQQMVTSNQWSTIWLRANSSGSFENANTISIATSTHFRNCPGILTVRYTKTTD